MPQRRGKELLLEPAGGTQGTGLEGGTEQLAVGEAGPYRAALFVAALLIPAGLLGAGKGKKDKALPVLASEHAHPSGDLTFRSPEGWQVAAPQGDRTLIEAAGFACAYMTGAGTSAAHGYPDFGLITMSEMVANARRITAISGIPLISDADTGYGNELNVYRTIQEFERAGVAGVHIEDQGFPKKCGHLDDKEIVSLDEYLPKIRAAAAARTACSRTRMR